MTDKILTRKDGAIAHVVFNNPDKLNAISLEMWQGLGDAVEGFEADPQVRVDRALRRRRQGLRRRRRRLEVRRRAHGRERRRALRANRREGAVGALQLEEGDDRRDRRLLHRRRHLGRGVVRPAHRDGEVAIRAAGDALRHRLPLQEPAPRHRPDRRRRREGPADRRRDVRRAGGVRQRPRRQGAARGRLHGRGAEAGRQDRRRRAADARAGEVRDRADREGPRRSATSTKPSACSSVCYASEDYREGIRAFAEKRKPQFKGR